MGKEATFTGKLITEERVETVYTFKDGELVSAVSGDAKGTDRVKTIEHENESPWRYVLKCQPWVLKLWTIRLVLARRKETYTKSEISVIAQAMTIERIREMLDEIAANTTDEDLPLPPTYLAALDQIKDRVAGIHNSIVVGSNATPGY